LHDVSFCAYSKRLFSSSTFACCTNRAFFVHFRQVLICGVTEIDVDDWERQTIYRSYTPNAKQVRWFWQVRRGSPANLGVTSHTSFVLYGFIGTYIYCSL
jgi:hypothetical protein